MIEVDMLEFNLKVHMSICAEQELELRELRAQLAVFREALEEYADKDHWIMDINEAGAIQGEPTMKVLVDSEFPWTCAEKALAKVKP